jgi:thiamine biosynthesis protein ThiI
MQSVDQVRQLATILTRFQFRSKLFLLPFAEVQQNIVVNTPQHLRVILYRRLMFRIAEVIARQEGAEALVTGEAVGQVASQTLRNIRVINEVVTLPVLRPLSGMDKEDTMKMARSIGTYEISKEPYDDCCSFLAPRKPETWASPDEVHDAEAALDIPALIRLSMNASTVEVVESKIPLPADSDRSVVGAP